MKLINFLSHLSIDRNVSINTQKTALNTIVFMYVKFLQQEIGTLQFRPSVRPSIIPTVFSHREALAVINQLSGRNKLIASLMYGSGLRVMEASRLRIQDIDLDGGYIVVREAKGLKWRRTLLPDNLFEHLSLQIKAVLSQHQVDLEAGFGSVYLPNALSKKYPSAGKSPQW